MQSSKYNILFPENDEYILLNTYSKKIVKMNKAKYAEVKSILESDHPENCQNTALIHRLKEFQFLIDEGDQTLEKLQQNCVDLVMSKTLHITMMMTYTCNFDCIYCFQNHIPNSLMTDEMVEKTLDFVRKEIREKKIERLYVEWFGGEPLILKKKMLYLHKQFRTIAKEFHIPYYSRITTNGYELDLDTFNELYKNHCFVYYISLDGSRTTHDRQRPLKNKSGTYDVIIKNLKAIHDHVSYKNFRIEIRINNSSSTMKELGQFLAEFAKIFGNDSRFALVFDVVQDWGDRTKTMQDELIAKDQLEESAMLATKYNLNLVDFSFSSLETQICQAAKKNAFSIFYDGSIIKCQMALERDQYKDLNVVGNVVTGIDENRERVWVDDKFPDQCNHCVALPLCYGKKCVFTTKVKQEKCTDIESALIDQIKLEKQMSHEIEEI